MNDVEWIILDTETNGLLPPIAAVELAAQRMRGWAPVGEPLRFLLNQNAEISPEASRVNGYTREILERDGEPPAEVYRAFAEYADGRPLVSYNLSFDLDQVLIPEWERFGVPPAGERGFCALRLAQRLLDPVPAGNCKLQTLRQYYKLPERGAHTALGDVETTIDLLQHVLRPIAESRGLSSWQDLMTFAEEEWFPSRLTFGKHKGRDYSEAKTDEDFRGWLEWLCNSTNERSARMGRWYLDSLAQSADDASPREARSPFPSPERQGPDQVPSDGRGVVIFVDQSQERLRELIAYSRSRLAELEAEYTEAKSNVDAINAALFRLVRNEFQRRDQLRLIVNYRRLFRDTLISGGDEEAEQVSEEYTGARNASDKEYEDADRITEDKTELTQEELTEIKQLWKKLVRLFHPDLYHDDPDKQATYEKLVQAINEARERGDIDTLREIANDPDGFITRNQWGEINIGKDGKQEDLLKLYRAIEIRIVELIEQLQQLRESAEFELMTKCREQSGLLDQVAEQHKDALRAEIEELAAVAKALEEEIQELSGASSGI